MIIITRSLFKLKEIGGEDSTRRRREFKSMKMKSKRLER
jgi:hypothetical protein